MKMNKEHTPLFPLLALVIVLLVVTAVGITYLFQDQSTGIVYTEYDIISIDNERLTYIDSDNKIRSINWVGYPKFVSVYTSDRTYLIIETGTNEYYRKYNLYLNVSDLE